MESESINLYQHIQTMTVAEKIKFALHANKEARALLLKDPNRQVTVAVMSSPKLTEEEILQIAQSRNTSDEVLRIVVKNMEWLKSYPICSALVNNPKTPLATAVTLISRLNKRDLSLLAKNKNVPEAVRVQAKKTLLVRQA